MTQDTPATRRSPAWIIAVEIALIFAVLFLQGCWPTPDNNETHHLAKAKHFWDATAYPNDFFCNTADAHGVFYSLFGWVTLLMPLDAAAWTGRCATWLLLAIAWRGLSNAIVPRRWFAILSAELFVLLARETHMAGEWIIGGVEAKGFAYAFVLWALHALVRGRWNLVWPLLGAATSLHVVVGGWAIVCAAIVWIISKRDRPTLVSMLPGLAAGVVLATPGLWFAGAMNRGVDPATVQQAIEIQVFQRLPHHLLPRAFRDGYIARHLLAWTLFGLLCSITPATAPDRRFRWFVGATMILSTMGFAWGCLALIDTHFAAQGLRFYWFRLSDIMVPAGIALVGLQCLVAQFAAHRRRARWWTAAIILVALIDLGARCLWLPGIAPLVGNNIPRPDRHIEYDEWRDVCRWAANNTPPGTVFLTPRRSITFKWHSGRDEAVIWKDMPQDAVNLVKWWTRLTNLYGPDFSDTGNRWERPIDFSHVMRCARRWGAQYVILDVRDAGPQPSAPAPVFFEPPYMVYQVDQPD